MIETHKEDEFDINPFFDGFFKALTIAIFCGVIFVINFTIWHLIPNMIDPKPVNSQKRIVILEREIMGRMICDTVHLDRATTYRPTVAQCDSDPLTTADGSRINPDSLQRWVALSRDLLYQWGGEFSYDDTITIYSELHPNLNGEWEVHDCMNSRYKMSIDFLMEPEKNNPKLGVGKDVKIIVCSENY